MLGESLFVLLLFLLFFLVIFLAGKGIRKPPLLLLAFFFLALALNLLDSFLLLEGAYKKFPGAGLWGSNLLLVCGPLLYFYTKSVIDPGFTVKRKDLVHFTPFAALFIASEISYLSAGYVQQEAMLTAIAQRQLPPAFYILSIVLYGHFVAYLLFSLSYIRQYKKVPETAAPTLPAALRWTAITLLFFQLMIPLLLLTTYLSFAGKIAAYFAGMLITVLLLLAFITWIFSRIMHDPAIFERQAFAAGPSLPSLPVRTTTPEMEALMEQVIKHMQQQKPFLDSSLSLEGLASQLTIKPKQLSQAINTIPGQSFFEFINEYRIEEAKKKLTRPKDPKITILEVMYEVGFNSKSSFNTLFKQRTGLTPGEFKKKHVS